METIITNIIIIAVILLIVGLAVFYVIKAKKSGKKCIGCPDSGTCGASSKASACSCGCSGCASKDSCHSDNSPE